MENLIQRLNRAIDVEYDTKNEEVNETLSLPLEDRIAKGDTITNITTIAIAEFATISAILSMDWSSSRIEPINETSASNDCGGIFSKLLVIFTGLMFSNNNL